MRCPSCAHVNRDAAKFCEECAAPLARSCASCGAALRASAKFCDECAAPIGAAEQRDRADDAVARKVVTILFSDLIGSVSLQERLDPESASRVMERYHRLVRAGVEEHGGTLVQLIGDGVMCAFGVPHVAEDDAIRAVRAGVGIQRAFREFAREESARCGTLGLRVAVNTGEVVPSDDLPAGIGDPLNVAARLQQEAREGDVLIGESTARLVRELVTLERTGVFALKGRSGTVAAYRVVSLDRPAGASATPFVGREDELERISAVYDQTVTSRRARLAVILGSPGLGKSRLMDEFGRRLGEGATVLRAHCDTAGGATFAPLARALRSHLGVDDAADGDTLRAAIDARTPGSDAEHARIGDGIAELLAGRPASPEETFFVVRRFLAMLAAAGPVVLAIDDLQWAEPLLLDLVEHLIQWTTDVPLLLLVAARPELRETRSSLAAPGGLVAEVVTLAGLDAGAATRLAANVIGADELPAAVAGRVLATSEGNPLFVGELVRMLVHDGALKREGDRWTTGVELARLEMPPTIQALLAARIERLRPEERTVLERAAVVGRQFSRAAVTHLLPREITDLDARLEALRRSELIEPDTGWFLGEPALRFHHVLIRDAAYRRVLKGTRAELHGRFAEWLESRVGAAVEHDETLGWHLEQAHQHLRELGPIDAQGRALGERAARYLAAAGRRALARDDLPLAASLLGRAVDRLDAADPARADLALDWCEALLAAGDVGPAASAIDELGRFTADSERLRAWHTCFAGERAALTDPQALRATAGAAAAAAEALASLGDAAGEAKAHFVEAMALARLGRVGSCEAALDRALAAARRGNDRRRSNAVLANAPLAALWGPSPVARASGRCLDVVRVLRITQGAPAVEAVALRCQGVLEALRGRAEAARRMIASSRHMVEELGITHRLLEADVFAGLVELLEGDAAAAERWLRPAYDGLRAHGLGIDAARAAALLGRALLAEGRAAEAEALSHESEALAGDDLQAAIAWRGVRAEALARRGEHAAAVDLARVAVDLAAATDSLLYHADARLALATALRAAGRGNEAAAEEARAIELWEAKGATLLAERARREVGHVGQVERAPDDRAGPARPARRQVRANAATANAARLEAAVSARDADALPTLFADTVKVVHHPSGAEHGREGALSTFRSLLTARDPTFQQKPVATLGDSLALCRISVSTSGGGDWMPDVGPSMMDQLLLVEVDPDGRRQRSELFAEDRLGAAVARLYERYAHLLPDGPERARAAATARSVAAYVGYPVDPDRLATALAPTVESVDHRTLGTFAARGAEAVLGQHRSWLDVGADIAVREDEILGLRSDALLVRRTFSGTDRAGGGAFERQFISLWIFGSDGLMTRIEHFDADRDAEALARFAELTIEPAAVEIAATLPRVAKKVRHRVRANAATAVAAANVAAVATRNPDALLALSADDHETTRHPTGLVYGRDGFLASMRSLLKAEGGTYRFEPLATLGDSLTLCRQSASASGFAGRKFDVGAYETETIGVFQVNDRGQYQRSEIFAADRLGDAIARLYERYAELLPDGPERARAAATARSVAAFVGPVDPDRLATVIAPNVESVDHRTLGTWSARGAEAYLEHFRSVLELACDVAMREDDILALRSDAFLSRRTHSGTARASGGVYERQYLALNLFGTDGLLTRIEHFDTDRDAEALARFDELTIEPAAVEIAAALPRVAKKLQRHVRPNAASASAARINAVIAARDADALPALFTDEAEVVDHPTGTTWDRQGILASYRSLLSARDPASRVEPLGTLGDSLALCRMSMSAGGFAGRAFDVGAYEREEINLNEVDAQGRYRRIEVFAADRMGDAVVRLYERYAELLPDGPAHARAAATARSVEALLGPPDRWPFAPDAEATDHRTVGFGSLRGGDAVLEAVRALLQLSDDFATRIDDVVALRSDALLVRWTTSGTVRVSGGAFERSLLMLWVFGADGLLTRWEQFDADRDAEALARFDGVAAEPAPARIAAARAPAPGKPERRVRPNAATANAARFAAAVAAGNADAFLTLYADDVEAVNHPTALTYDRRGALTSIRSVLRAKDVTFANEPLATLGDSLALCRVSMSASGASGGTFDVGAYANEMVLLIEVDAQGRRRREELFAADRMGHAVARLYERYAELLPDGPTRARGAATARSVATPGPGNLDEVDRLAMTLAPAIEVIDHRTIRFGSGSGTDTLLRSLRALLELTETFATRVDDVLALRSDALLLRLMNFGTEGAGGGAYERPFLLLRVFGVDGLVTRWEQFDAERDAEALARFDELTAEPRAARIAAAPAPEKRGPRVRPNAATANIARLDAAVAARDADVFPTLLADEVEAVNHPTGSVHDRQGVLATWCLMLRAQDLTHRLQPLATLGDSLALCRGSISASGFAGGRFDVGAYEIEDFSLIEVNAQGRRRRLEGFAVDRLGDAIVRLYERYAELLPDGPERVRAAATARSVAADVGPFDLDRFATALAPAVVSVDHRTLGTWSARGVEALLTHYRSLLDLADDVTMREDDILGLRSDAFLVRRTHLGTDRAGGGTYEREFLALRVFGADGFMTRSEVFDVDRGDQALARFDELTAEPAAVRFAGAGSRAAERRERRMRPNAATAHAARLDAAIAARDADAFPPLFADGMKVVHHPTGAEWGREGVLSSWRVLVKARDPMCLNEPLATLGDSLALCRWSLSASGGAGWAGWADGGPDSMPDIGAYEMDQLRLIEVDPDGRSRLAEIFAADRIGHAIARLYERYAEILPDGPERTRAAATARSVGAMLGSYELDRWATAIAPTLEYVDHRLTGFPPARGPAAFLQGVRTLLELASDVAMRVDDVLCLRSDALLIPWAESGIDRATGGRYERHFLLVWIFDASGLLTRIEQFDVERRAEALARFDELTAEPPATARIAAAAATAPEKRERRLWANAATAHAARLDAAFAARDAAALPTLFADGMKVVHHPTGAEHGREGVLFSLRSLLKAQDPTLRHEPLVTLGDSVGLFRMSWSASGAAEALGMPDIGPTQMDQLILIEADPHGRRRRSEVFAADRMGDAVSRLYERYADLLPDGPARIRAAATARSVAAMEGPLDLDRSAATLDSSVESIDHRTLGTWSFRGAEAFLQNLRAWFEVAESVTLRNDDVLAVRPDALLGRWTNFGTDRVGGGTFERPYLRLVRFGADGRLTRNEVFDVDRDAEALERFDELAAEPSRAMAKRPRRVRSNAATANVDRLEAAIGARDTEALADVFADGSEFVEHPTGAVYDRPGALITFRSFLNSQDPTFRQEVLATLGDSLALHRQTTSASGFAGRTFDVGAFEREELALIEVDGEGRRRRGELFASDHLGDAVTRLFERYAEILPDGPARVRAAATARSVAAMLGPFDLDRYGTVVTPALEFADHRTLPMGPVRGGEALREWVRTLGEVATDIAFRVDDVHGLRSDALLVRWTRSGTDRAGGGAFENQFLFLWVFGSDGLVMRIEWFDTDRDAEALARFDELTTESAAARIAPAASRTAEKRKRRVCANAATANADRLDAAIAARDPDALPALLAEPTEVVDHTTGVTFDWQGELATWRSLLSARDPTHLHEPLATLGDALALTRVTASASGFVGRTFDVGAYEGETIVLIEVDAQGRRLGTELFAADRLGDAVARLYERYAELLPDGPARARATATARSVAAMLGRFDLGRYATVVAPALEFANHRTLAMGPVRGGEGFRQWLRTLGEVATDLAFRFEDVLGLRSDALLVRWTTSGTDRASGGAFENQFLFLWVFGSDGLVTRIEWFDTDRDAEALARFDEIAAESAAAPIALAPSRAADKRARRVQPNAATANAARLDAAIAARDTDALATQYADDLETVEHTSGVTYDRQGALASWRSLLSARDPTCRHEALATLCDSLALFRTSTSGSGFTGRTFDVGAYEREHIDLIEVDAQGRRRRHEAFAADRLGDAVARLYERYAELLPDGPERVRAAATARSVAAYVGPMDLDRYAASFAPVIDAVDHRTLGTWSARGAEELHRHFRSMLELADAASIRDDDVLSLQPDAFLLRKTHLGTARVSGGAYERPFLLLLVFGADGLVTRFEWFDTDRDAQALARFDELTAAPPNPMRIPPNAAWHVRGRFPEAIAARDWPAVRALASGDFMYEDRRKRSLLAGGIELWLKSVEFMAPLIDADRGELIGTVGERVALERVVWAGAPDTGAFEIEKIRLMAIDADGRLAALINFDLDDRGAAFAEAHARFVAGEATSIGGQAPIVAFGGAFTRRDWESLRACLADDVALRDHRPLQIFDTLERDQWIESMRTLVDLAPDVDLESFRILAWNCHGRVDVNRVTGTWPHGGGPFENAILRVIVTDGARIQHFEFFDVGDGGQALARFAELTAEPEVRIAADPSRAAQKRERRVRANAATANAARLDAAIAARDSDALPTLYAELTEVVDHTTGVTYDRQGEIASWRSLLRARDPTCRHEALATLGNSLALCRTSMAAKGFSGGKFDVGAYEREQIHLVEVDAQGRRRRAEAFAVDKLGYAVARLYERYAELLPDGPARIRAAAAARVVATHVGPHDVARYATAIAPTIEWVDRRTLGLGSVRGADETLRVLRSIDEVAHDVANRVDDVLDLRSDAYLLRWTNFGTDHVSGGAYERLFLVLWVFGTDGLVTHWELFDADRDAEALARFDELVRSPI